MGLQNSLNSSLLRAPSKPLRRPPPGRMEPLSRGRSGGMDVLQKLSKSDRQTRILGELRASSSIRISVLAAALGVSGETIRRDLLEMGETGLLSRTYGGAVARPFGFEPAWNER